MVYFVYSPPSSGTRQAWDAGLSGPCSGQSKPGLPLSPPNLCRPTPRLLFHLSAHSTAPPSLLRSGLLSPILRPQKPNSLLLRVVVSHRSWYRSPALPSKMSRVMTTVAGRVTSPPLSPAPCLHAIHPLSKAFKKLPHEFHFCGL